MSRRLERWRGRLAADLPEVVVCRGGDCGSRRKHPGFDHVGQLARIREELAGVATVSVSRCLDACECSNVVVVVPGSRARDAGVQPLWVGQVLDDATTTAVLDRVRADDVGAEPSDPVASHRFDPSGRSRHSLSARRRSR